MVVVGVRPRRLVRRPRAADVKAVGQLVGVGAEGRAARPRARVMRSLSLTRSSAAPVTRSSPPAVASTAKTGNSSMTAGTILGAELERRRGRARSRECARPARPASRRSARRLDAGAEAAEHVEQAGARRIQAHALDGDVGARQGRRRHRRKGRRRDVAGHAGLERRRVADRRPRRRGWPSRTTAAPNAVSARSV